MKSVEGVITLTQEGRFELATDGAQLCNSCSRMTPLSNRKACRHYGKAGAAPGSSTANLAT
jgi:hypothetical protein